MVRSRTSTAPTCLRSQVARVATTRATFMKYSSQLTRWSIEASVRCAMLPQGADAAEGIRDYDGLHDPRRPHPARRPDGRARARPGRARALRPAPPDHPLPVVVAQERDAGPGAGGAPGAGHGARAGDGDGEGGGPQGAPD